MTGMVLQTAPVGEYDRRVVILTKEQGKISAFARGARKPNSPLVGVVNPFTFGQFTLYAGRSSYTIQSVHVENYFSELRDDIIAGKDVESLDENIKKAKEATRTGKISTTELQNLMNNAETMKKDIASRENEESEEKKVIINDPQEMEK